MKQSIFCLSLLIALTVNAETINVRGKISNSSGEAISNAIVTLVKQGLVDTTGTDGSYSLTTTTTSTVYSPLIPSLHQITMDNGVLELNLSNPSSVKIDIYDIKGNMLKQEKAQRVSAGVYHINVLDKTLATNVLLIKASINNHSATFHYLPFNKGKYTINFNEEGTNTFANKLGKVAAVNDTLKVSATGFDTSKVAITSYDTTVNITLDSTGAAAGSAGCGKTLSSLKSGTYTITSAGLSRSYIIDIPTDYDKNKPYRLIFAMHCMGGSAAKVASETTDETAYFYHLKPYSTSNNIPVIFVAPQGYSDSWPWRTGDNKDHTFFSDMLSLFKDSLCVDTTRIFACGYSFGAMFTYSLSLEFQDQLRAVACYAPANYNIYLPTNTHKPIAYMQTTGTTDGTCPWIYSDANKQGGKYCLLTHIEDNGCSDPSSISLATSSSAHVSTVFCDGEYPVKFGSFVGGHGCNNTENGVNWIPKETWEFFMQF